jgi:hypothetical protein
MRVLSDLVGGVLSALTSLVLSFAVSITVFLMESSGARLLMLSPFANTRYPRDLPPTMACLQWSGLDSVGWGTWM